jgi:hypothetical protein
MDLSLTLEPNRDLIVHLCEGDVRTSVVVAPAQAGATTLTRALSDAMHSGFGECFWPGRPGGQYWWMFKRDAETLETVVMWTRGGASLWEHVFRATDAAAWVQDRVAAELSRLGLSRD